MMLEQGVLPDVAHTSLQKRAIRTTQFALENCARHWVPVRRSWRLNERHYGALQGLNKAETAAKFGEAQVKIWRRAYDIAPPPLEKTDERFPGKDRRYADLKPAELPATECLKDTVARFLPYWHETIAPAIRVGKSVIVAAHGNSLRALVKHLDGLSEDEIVSLNIPTGIPLVYQLNEDLTPIRPDYLGAPEAAKRAAEAVANQSKAK